jgi:hypothetical protein
MGIFIKPMDRMRRLERENARLRALVGEAAPVEPVEGEEQQPAPTLIEKTDTLEESALDLAELQSEMLYQLCLMEMGVNANDL